MRGTQWLQWPPLDDLFNRPHALVWLTFLFDSRGRRRLLVGNGEGRFSWVNPHPHLLLWTTKSVMFLSEIRSQIPCVLMSGPPGTHISIIVPKDERENKMGMRWDEDGGERNPKKHKQKLEWQAQWRLFSQVTKPLVCVIRLALANEPKRAAHRHSSDASKWSYLSNSYLE